MRRSLPPRNRPVYSLIRRIHASVYVITNAGALGALGIGGIPSCLAGHTPSLAATRHPRLPGLALSAAWPLARSAICRVTASVCVRICSPPNATVVSPRRHRRRSRRHRLGAANDSFFTDARLHHVPGRAVDAGGVLLPLVELAARAQVVERVDHALDGLDRARNPRAGHADGARALAGLDLPLLDAQQVTCGGRCGGLHAACAI